MDTRLFHEAGVTSTQVLCVQGPFPFPSFLAFCPLWTGLWLLPGSLTSTSRASDHVWPSGAFGIPLNRPRFLEWVGVPESANLLELGQWLDTLSRDQAMAAAIQLHRDVCLMTTNLDILYQYALSLQGTASKILESSIGSSV